MYADFIYVWLYMECGYPTVDINYVNYYLCDFSFTHIHVNIMLA